MGKLTRTGFITVLVMVALAVLPPMFLWSGQAFYMDLATRLVILAIAAVSLNLILGFGGLVSFGHAAFIGLGAYAAGIPSYHATWGGFEAIATYNGLFQIALAVGISALYALVTGAIALRTKGVYFIMITMAFGQMAYYFFLSLDIYGGDDGLTIDVRSELPGINLDNPLSLYLLAYVSLVVAMVIKFLIVNSRFGMVLQGAKGNPERMVTLGYNIYLYRLVAYVISGAMAGYAGFLLGNFTTFISPDMLDWTRSGELMFMVILGGAATIVGPVLGASVFILLEEILSSYTIFWQLPFGLMLIGVVLFIRGGLMGFFKGKGD
ncbi:MAG: branched-chain amino acid ABC transporter permease [Rhodobacteraceae bacterium]|nr:MAG: branched-chain amino acid ABC transporter permease [Paracoccaceae bacterium]